MSILLATALVSTTAIGALGSLAGGKTTSVSAETTGQVFDENNIALTVATISDPHIGYAGNDQKLNNTLTVLKEFAPNGIDMFLSAGDNTQNGVEEEAKYFMEILGAHFDLTKVPIVAAHGNHDTYWSGCMNAAQFYDAYGEAMYTFDTDKEAAKKGNRHIEFGGYHFITVQIASYMPDVNNLTAETKTWLSNKLAAINAEDPNKPIFVVSHSPQLNTIYGSILGDPTDKESVQYGDISRNEDTAHWGSSRDFDAILNNYPQTILISGHTHYANNNELSIMQTGYTSFTPGGAADLAANKDTVETQAGVMPEARSHSQGTLMEIDKDNNVRITRIDFVKKEQIKQPWIIPAPKADKSHLQYYRPERGNTTTAPEFESDALEVIAASTNSVRVIYPTAKDDDMVYSYRITLKNASGGTMATVTTLSPWVYYPDLSKLPTSNSYLFQNVKLNYPCTAEIVAIDCWGKESEPLTKVIQDPTEDDIRYAGEFDTKVSGFGEVAESSFEAIVALRAEYNAMSYSRKGRVTKYAQLVELEKAFYQTYAVEEIVKENGVTDASKYFSAIPSTTRGKVETSAFCGVDISWTGATLNNPVGLNRTFDLDGLTISFGGLEMESEDKLLGFIFSSKARDKYTASESLLIQADLSTGRLSVGGGNLAQTLGTSACLTYDNAVSRPVELTIRKTESAYALIVSAYGMESETFELPVSAVESATNLTDTTKVFASVTPWAKGTTGKMNLYAIYNKPVADETPDETPNTSDSATNSGADKGEEKGGCGSVTAIAAVPVVIAAAVALSKKKED